MRSPSFLAVALAFAGAAAAACSTTVTTTNPPPGETPGTSSGGTQTPAPDVDALLPSAIALTEIKSFGAGPRIVDLAFHHERKEEVWVLGQADNSTHVGTGVLGAEAKWQRFVDPAARHFMHRPTAIAMGDQNDWGTCGDNDNRQNEPDQIPNFFMGPALFSADLTIFAKRTPTGLGSHLDMLHSSSFCRGIAHVVKRQYWVFNANDSALDFYDFREDHGPGNDDHSDGQIFRYADGEVKGAADGTPSHLFYDATDKFHYVADTGNARIVKLDTTKGTKKGRQWPPNEKLEPDAWGYVEDTHVEVVVPEGVLPKPSGLEIIGDKIYVTDAETSEIVVFDKAGKELRRVATDLPAGALAGFVLAPDGKIWLVDRSTGTIFRVDAR